MRLTSFYTVLGCAVAFLLTSSLMVEQCSGIRVHTVGVSANSAAEAAGFVRRLAADGTVEPTPDQAASRIFKNMESVGRSDERSSRFGSSTTASDAVEKQLCASVTVPIAACTGRRHSHF